MSDNDVVSEDTWYSDLRWRVGLYVVKVGLKLCPAGDVRTALVDNFLEILHTACNIRIERERIK